MLEGLGHFGRGDEGVAGLLAAHERARASASRIAPMTASTVSSKVLPSVEMIRASTAGRSGATARVESSSSRRRSASRIARASSLAGIQVTFFGPASGSLLDRGIQEELEVRVGQHDRADVATGHDDPAGRREVALPGEQCQAELRDRRDRRDSGVHLRSAHVIGVVRAVDDDPCQPAVRVRRQFDLVHEAAHRVRVRRGQLASEREPGHGPIQQARVAEPVATGERGGRAHAALAGRARAIERDDELAAHSGGGFGRDRDEPPPEPRPRTSGALRGRTRPDSSPSMRTGPIRTRTSRSIGAPTAPNMRRSWRFQPWARVARYQVSGSGAGRSSAAEAFDLGVGHRSQPAERGEPFLDGDARLEGLDLLAVEPAAQADGVLAFHAVSRVQDALRPLPVVGEDQQALGIEVQAADRVQPRALGHQRGRQVVQDRLGGVAVADRRRDTGRLVQQQVRLLRRGPDDPAVDRDDRPRAVDLRADARDLAIDGDAPVGDEDLGLPARRDAGRRDDLLEPFRCHQSAISRVRG